MKTILFLIIITTLVEFPSLAAQDPIMPEDQDSLAQIFEQKRLEMQQIMSEAEIAFLVTNSEYEGFGYFIFIDGQMIIDQKTIPAIKGNHGFKSRKDAECVAQYAIEKIKQGYMPPTLSVEELQSMPILLPVINHSN